MNKEEQIQKILENVRIQHLADLEALLEYLEQELNEILPLERI